MKLSDIRAEIDNIDDKILELLEKRMECSEKVAQIKLEKNEPVLNKDREKQILLDIAEKSPRYYREKCFLFENMMDISRQIQYNMISDRKPSTPRVGCFNSENAIVACQGTCGSFSERAAQKLFKNNEIRHYDTLPEVFDALKHKKVDFAVLPIENSSAGSVHEVYDLLLEHKFYIIEEVQMKIDHCICGINGADLSSVKYVYSHPQAIAQCSKFIKDNNLNAVYSRSTAIAAKNVSECGDIEKCAICSKRACDRYGLNILKSNVQDNDDNTTRFIVISRDMYVSENANKISVCFSLPNKSGMLYKVLLKFYLHDLNLTKIESRSIRNKKFEYMFYLDFEGNTRRKLIDGLLMSLSLELDGFRVLGNYEEK